MSRIKKHFDYLIVGAGLAGATFASIATANGKKCLVIEKQSKVGGNIRTERISNIDVHLFGPHIFHTSDEIVWKFINLFGKFNNFINQPIANYKGEIYNLPFNMNTFSKLWNIGTPEEARAIIEKQKVLFDRKPENLEEQALSLVGKDIYEKLIKEYTEKQWGRDCKELPAFIIKRIPIRFTYDNNYFNDKYQGIPENGYTEIINNMLIDSDVLFDMPFERFKSFGKNISYDKIVYTGPIDEYYGYCFGELQYRSLRFENSVYNIDSYQGNAVVNYTSKDEKFTRMIEHKFFNKNRKSNKTIVTKEYPLKWSRGRIPYYPINDEENNKLYSKYKDFGKENNNIIFCGRLGSYKYMDMDKVIRQVIDKCKEESLLI